jgi:hypothetical protein
VDARRRVGPRGRRAFGVQAPDLPEDGSFATAGGEAAKARLDALVRDADLALEWEGERQLFDGAHLCHVFDAKGKSLAAILLEEGLVRLCLEDAAMRHADLLRSAQEKAKAAKVGLWAREAKPPPPLDEILGAAIGLYSQDPEHDYGPFLVEMKDLGATHVEISSSWLMFDWRSNEFGPVKGRTPSWGCVERTTKQARDLGLDVAYLPLVLLQTGTRDHWRGDIAPTKLWLWFRNYGRYVARFADLAREQGAALVSVGSEYTTLERHTGAWKTIIANVRSRCDSKLTYSANWDHLRVIKFWNDLDYAGMTAYHSLSKKDDPTVEELTASWRDIRDRLLLLQKDLEIPFFFTELGYPSQDGANKDPWNYFINPQKPDLEEQADCYRAFTIAWDEAPRDAFKGFFIWKWWRNGDKSDLSSYSIHGKPAYDVMKAWIAKRRAVLKK